MSRKRAQIFRRAEQHRDRVHIPIVCFFELAMLLERGRVKSSLTFDDWHDRVAAFPGLPIEPLTWEDIREARGLVGWSILLIALLLERRFVSMPR